MDSQRECRPTRGRAGGGEFSERRRRGCLTEIPEERGLIAQAGRVEAELRAISQRRLDTHGRGGALVVSRASLSECRVGVIKEHAAATFKEDGLEFDRIGTGTRRDVIVGDVPPLDHKLAVRRRPGHRPEHVVVGP